MAKGVSFQQISQVLGQAIKKGTPQQVIAREAISQGQTFLNEKFGYDFVGLGVKIVVYFLITFLFAKFMEAVIFLKGGWVDVANLLGFSIPKADQVPESLKKLFDGGISGFKFWDIVKIILIILVIAEFIRYVNLPQKSSPMTIGIFLGIISILAITTFPELVKRIKLTDFNLEAMK